MKTAVFASVAVVLVAVLAVVLVASTGLSPVRQLHEDGFLLEGVIEMASSADGLRTVIAVAGRNPGESLLAFVVQHYAPSTLTYSGPVRLSFKPGVLYVATPNGAGWQFSVRRRGVFVPSVSSSVRRESVIGIASRQVDFATMTQREWVVSLLAGARPQIGNAGQGAATPSGGDSMSAVSCPEGAPNACTAGGIGSTSCSYTCGGTSASTSCASEYYACCWCNGVAEAGCCPVKIGGASHSRGH